MKLKVTDDSIYITKEMAEDVRYIPEWARQRLVVVDFSKEEEEQEDDSDNKKR